MRKSNILALVKQSIADKEMNIVVGGAFKSCECACIYENQGGASTADNAVLIMKIIMNLPKVAIE